MKISKDHAPPMPVSPYNLTGQLLQHGINTLALTKAFGRLLKLYETKADKTPGPCTETANIFTELVSKDEACDALYDWMNAVSEYWEMDYFGTPALFHATAGGGLNCIRVWLRDAAQGTVTPSLNQGADISDLTESMTGTFLTIEFGGNRITAHTPVPTWANLMATAVKNRSHMVTGRAVSIGEPLKFDPWFLMTALELHRQNQTSDETVGGMYVWAGDCSVTPSGLDNYFDALASMSRLTMEVFYTLLLYGFNSEISFKEDFVYKSPEQILKAFRQYLEIAAVKGTTPGWLELHATFTISEPFTPIDQPVYVFTPYTFQKEITNDQR